MARAIRTSQKPGHAAQIDKLGGPAKVRSLLAAKGHAVQRAAIQMWRKKGIPWKFRNVFALLLVESGLAVPGGFTQPEVKHG